MGSNPVGRTSLCTTGFVLSKACAGPDIPEMRAQAFHAQVGQIKPQTGSILGVATPKQQAFRLKHVDPARGFAGRHAGGKAG